MMRRSNREKGQRLCDCGISERWFYTAFLILIGIGYLMALLVLLFLAIASDIAAWFLTHWVPHYALVVVIAGAVLGLCLASRILISLYQPWFGKTAKPDLSMPSGTQI